MTNLSANNLVLIAEFCSDQSLIIIYKFLRGKNSELSNLKLLNQSGLLGDELHDFSLLILTVSCPIQSYLRCRNDFSLDNPTDSFDEYLFVQKVRVPWPFFKKYLSRKMKNFKSCVPFHTTPTSQMKSKRFR